MTALAIYPAFDRSWIPWSGQAFNEPAQPTATTTVSCTTSAQVQDALSTGSRVISIPAGSTVDFVYASTPSNCTINIASTARVKGIALYGAATIRINGPGKLGRLFVGSASHDITVDGVFFDSIGCGLSDEDSFTTIELSNYEGGPSRVVIMHCLALGGHGVTQGSELVGGNVLLASETTDLLLAANNFGARTNPPAGAWGAWVVRVGRNSQRIILADNYLRSKTLDACYRQGEFDTLPSLIQYVFMRANVFARNWSPAQIVQDEGPSTGSETNECYMDGNTVVMAEDGSGSGWPTVFTDFGINWESNPLDSHKWVITNTTWKALSSAEISQSIVNDVVARKTTQTYSITGNTFVYGATFDALLPLWPTRAGVNGTVGGDPYNNGASSGAFGSGADTTGVETDAGTGLARSSGSGTDSVGATDAGTGTARSSGSGADTAATTVDGGTNISPVVGTGGDTTSVTDAASATAPGVASGSDTASVTDAGTGGPAGSSGSGADVAAAASDAGTGRPVSAGSGADTGASTIDVGTGAISVSVSGADVTYATDAGTGAALSTGSGADVAQAVTDSSVGGASSSGTGGDSASASSAGTASAPASGYADLAADAAIDRGTAGLDAVGWGADVAADIDSCLLFPPILFWGCAVAAELDAGTATNLAVGVGADTAAAPSDDGSGVAIAAALGDDIVLPSEAGSASAPTVGSGADTAPVIDAGSAAAVPVEGHGGDVAGEILSCLLFPPLLYWACEVNAELDAGTAVWIVPGAGGDTTGAPTDTGTGTAPAAGVGGDSVREELDRGVSIRPCHRGPTVARVCYEPEGARVVYRRLDQMRIELVKRMAPGERIPLSLDWIEYLERTSDTIATATWETRGPAQIASTSVDGSRSVVEVYRVPEGTETLFVCTMTTTRNVIRQRGILVPAA